MGTVTDKIFQNLKFKNLLCGFGEIEKILVTYPSLIMLTFEKVDLRFMSKVDI